MKQYVVLIITVVITVVITLLLTNLWLFADEQQSLTITVTASVRPARLLVVDDSGTIQQVVSNTQDDIRPIVVLNKADGQEIPYSESIRVQYEKLKPTLNFSRPGVIYTREERPLQAFIKRINGSIFKTLRNPF